MSTDTTAKNRALETATGEFAVAGGISALTTDLLAYASHLAEFDPADITPPGETEPTGDVRLQYHAGEFYVRTGDSSFDQDGRGHWGASSVSPDLSEAAAREIAADLLGQVLDSVAQV